MGANIVRRLIRDGHDCVAYDVNAEAVAELVSEGAVGAGSLDEFIAELEKPRAVWVMVPAGEITESTVMDLAGGLEPGDAIIDGGNSYYRDDIRRAAQLAERGIDYIDCGTSGGVFGLERGYCLMIGGPDEAVARLEPIFASLAPGFEAAERTVGRDGEPSPSEHGYLHCGPSGSGHFVKMVHNGIEYGLLQAYGEGFEILERSIYDLNLHQIAELWRHGAVVRSWLLDLLASALSKDPGLRDVAGYVEDSGEGRWTVLTAIDEDVPAPVTALSLFARFASRQDESFAAKVIAALRHEFGGHAVREREE
jgi:6-phosphogluconate dehydrogenase